MVAATRQFGWLGLDSELRARDALLQEQQQQRLEDQLLVGVQAFKQLIKDPSRAIQARVDLLQSEFRFDKGWAFWGAVARCNGGKQLPPGPQPNGNCVGASSTLATVDLIAEEIFVCGEAEQFFIPYCPFSYGAGRIYVGGSGGYGDGSNGSWQAKANRDYGYLPLDTPGLGVDLSDPLAWIGTRSANKEFGARRSVLDKWLPEAKPFHLKRFTIIESGDQLWDLVVDYRRPVTIASNQGFTPAGYDSKYGLELYRMGGRWAHQMHIRSVFEIKGQQFVYVGNQWGTNAHRNPGRGFPLGGFVITMETFDRWVRSAYVAAYELMVGRPTPLPVFSIF